MTSTVSTLNVPHPPHQNFIIHLLPAEYEFASCVISDSATPLFHMYVVSPNRSPRNSATIFRGRIMNYYLRRAKFRHNTIKINSVNLFVKLKIKLYISDVSDDFAHYTSQTAGVSFLIRLQCPASHLLSSTVTLVEPDV